MPHDLFSWLLPVGLSGCLSIWLASIILMRTSTICKVRPEQINENVSVSSLTADMYRPFLHLPPQQSPPQTQPRLR